MSITIQLDLPEALIEQARKLGLLQDKRMAQLLADEVRRRVAGQDLKKMLDSVRAAPGEPVPIEEINAEIKAVRTERRAGETGR